MRRRAPGSSARDRAADCAARGALTSMPGRAPTCGWAATCCARACASRSATRSRAPLYAARAGTPGRASRSRASSGAALPGSPAMPLTHARIKARVAVANLHARRAVRTRTTLRLADDTRHGEFAELALVRVDDRRTARSPRCCCQQRHCAGVNARKPHAASRLFRAVRHGSRGILSQPQRHAKRSRDRFGSKLKQAKRTEANSA
jgi:hypothetical protein